LFFDLRSNAPDVSVDGAVVAVEIETPHLLQERFARENDTGIASQSPKQRELFGAQAHIDSVDASDASAFIEFEPAVAQNAHRRLNVDGLPPQDGAHATHDFAWEKRFDDEIVGTELERHNPVDLIGPAAEHKDGNDPLLASQRTHDPQSVDDRQTEIQDHEFRPFASMAQRRASVGGFDRLESLTIEVIDHQTSDGLIVVGYNDSHVLNCFLSDA
jgi:hypothetical protein